MRMIYIHEGAGVARADGDGDLGDPGGRGSLHGREARRAHSVVPSGLVFRRDAHDDLVEPDGKAGRDRGPGARGNPADGHGRARDRRVRDEQQRSRGVGQGDVVHVHGGREGRDKRAGGIGHVERGQGVDRAEGNLPQHERKVQQGGVFRTDVRRAVLAKLTAVVGAKDARALRRVRDRRVLSARGDKHHGVPVRNVGRQIVAQRSTGRAPDTLTRKKKNNNNKKKKKKKSPMDM